MSGGDPEFRALYERFAPRIRRYLSRLVGDADAEDLTQEVFARAHRALATRRGESLVSTWLFRIATNAAIDRLRSASRREEPGAREGSGDPDADGARAASSDGSNPGPPAADVSLIRSEMRRCILEHLDRLPPVHREVILLGELRELSDRQIADTLGITVEAAKMRLHRARRELGALLEGGCALYRDERNELACDRKPLAR